MDNKQGASLRVGVTDLRILIRAAEVGLYAHMATVERSPLPGEDDDSPQLVFADASINDVARLVKLLREEIEGL